MFFYLWKEGRVLYGGKKKRYDNKRSGRAFARYVERHAYEMVA